jgi:hypothetical protein
MVVVVLVVFELFVEMKIVDSMVDYSLIENEMNR